MSKLTIRTDVAEPVSMPPAVSAWFAEQTKRLTRNRSITSDAFGLYDSRVLPGKAPRADSSSRLDSILNSVTRLGAKLDSYRDPRATAITRPAVATPAASTVRADSAELIAANTRLAALKKEIDEMKTRLPAEVPPGQKGQFAATQASWETVAEAFGDAQVGHPLDGESLLDYTSRLASSYQKHSEPWRDVNLYEIRDAGVLNTVVNQIRADAVQAAKNPPVTEGVLTPRFSTDVTGRKVLNWHGDINVMLDPFRNPRRYVTGFPALAGR